MLTFKDILDQVKKWFRNESVLENNVKTKTVLKEEKKISKSVERSLIKDKKTSIESDRDNILSRRKQIFALQRGDLKSSEKVILSFHPHKDFKSIYECHILKPELISQLKVKNEITEIYFEKEKHKAALIYPAYMFCQYAIQHLSSWGEEDFIYSGIAGRWLDNDREVQNYLIECFNSINESYNFIGINSLSLIWLSKRNLNLHPKVKEDAWKKVLEKYENE